MKTSPMLPCGMNWPKILKIVSIIKHINGSSSYTCQGKEKGDGFYLTDSKKKKTNENDRTYKKNPMYTNKSVKKTTL